MDAAPTYAQTEALFLSSLEKSPLPTADLLALIHDIEVAETKSKSEEWTALLLETLTAANDVAGLYLVLKDRASQLASVLTPADIYNLLKKASKDRLFTAFLDSVGFGELPLPESFRRLDLLTSLKAGTQVIDPSWGFGTVKRLDDFYKKITLDFSGKPGHTMTFATACESLARAPHDHLLTLSHTDHAGVMRMASERPDQLVRCALQSFGDMPVTRLEDLLSRHKLVPASDWKRFWEAARKALKNDPLVIIPAKRADPIQLRAAVETYSAAWFEKLADTRDPLKILESVTELEEAGKLPGLEDSLRGVLEDRLAFAAKGCHNTDSALYARLAITISRLGFLTPPVEQLRAHLWERHRYIEAADGLAVRDIAAMATFLLAEGGHSATRMLEALPRMPFSLLNETLNLLKTTPEAEEACRRLLMLPDAPPALINWIFRFRKDLVWRLPPLIELLKHAIALVEGKLSGEALRMQNNLKLLFEQRKWLETVFEELDGPQRQLFFERIQASTAWDPSTHRSLIGRMLKLDPALSERKISPSAQNHAPVPVTSWRSLTERQLQYKKLIEVDLPKNSHDISVARSYGDLRENFEYQAAKDFQRQLLQRQSEMQLELKQIKGTDFSDAPCDKAGPGTTVTIRMPDGSCSTYTILGEWDRDESLNIISCKTRLALSLDGKAPGDEATIPMPGGETSVRIEAVAPLDEPIKAWIKAHPGEPA